jgi:uncharacterized protein (DUF302 family)
VNSYLNPEPADLAPQATMYVYGNPFIAANIMRHDISAGLNIPPRLLVLEKASGAGTRVIYLLPSSIMVIHGNAEQKATVELLDEKVEKLVVHVLTA